MSLNRVTYRTCGTGNPPDQDVCIECELPLPRWGPKGSTRISKRRIKAG